WSAAYAFGAAVIALVTGSAAALAVARARGWFARLFGGALLLPLAVPPVALALGLLLAFDTGHEDLRDSPWLVLFAHALIGYVVVLRLVWPRVRALHPHLAEAASVL